LDENPLLASISNKVLNNLMVPLLPNAKAFCIIHLQDPFRVLHYNNQNNASRNKVQGWGSKKEPLIRKWL
jgi:hypothetical protein